MNVQLGEKESIRVYVELDSKRILGFSPASAPLLNSGNTKYTSEILYHARDIERWMAKYREQLYRDAEVATFRQIKQESAFRKRITDAIKERNKHVDAFNRDLNNALLRLNNDRYDKMMAVKARPNAFGVAEGKEADPHAVEQMALAAYSKPVDTRASGASVDPKETVRNIYEQARQG